MQLQMKQIAGLLTALKMPFTASDEPPSEPVENQIWLNTSDFTLNIYIQDTNGPVWVGID